MVRHHIIPMSIGHEDRKAFLSSRPMQVYRRAWLCFRFNKGPDKEGQMV